MDRADAAAHGTGSTCACARLRDSVRSRPCRNAPARAVIVSSRADVSPRPHRPAPLCRPDRVHRRGRRRVRRPRVPRSRRRPPRSSSAGRTRRRATGRRWASSIWPTGGPRHAGRAVARRRPGEPARRAVGAVPAAAVVPRARPTRSPAVARPGSRWRRPTRSSPAWPSPATSRRRCGRSPTRCSAACTAATSRSRSSGRAAVFRVVAAGRREPARAAATADGRARAGRTQRAGGCDLGTAARRWRARHAALTARPRPSAPHRPRSGTSTAPPGRPQLAHRSVTRRRRPREGVAMATDTDHRADDPTDHRDLAARCAAPADSSKPMPYLLGFHPPAAWCWSGWPAARSSSPYGWISLISPSRGPARRRGGRLDRSRRAGRLVAIVRRRGALRHRSPAGGCRRPTWPTVAAARSSLAAAGVARRSSAGRPASVVVVLCARRPGCCAPAGSRWTGLRGRGHGDLSPAWSPCPTGAALAAALARPGAGSRASCSAPRWSAERRRRGGAATVVGRAQRRSVKRALFAAARGADAARVPRTRRRPTRRTAPRSPSALRRRSRPRRLVAGRRRRGDSTAARCGSDLARRLPAPYDAAPLFLFGWASWRSGNGALAGIAAERALDSDPSYSAADLLLARSPRPRPASIRRGCAAARRAGRDEPPGRGPQSAIGARRAGYRVRQSERR